MTFAEIREEMARLHERVVERDHFVMLSTPTPCHVVMDAFAFKLPETERLSADLIVRWDSGKELA